MSYKIIFVMIAILDYKIKQINVKTAFLYENIEENIYIKQFTSFNIDNLICKLKKILYNLK